MAYWGGGGAAGWGGGRGMGGGGGRMGRTDGWDYDELGAVYDHALVKRLVPFLAPYKTRALIALLSMIVNSVANYTQPFIMAFGIKGVVDKLLESSDAALSAAERQTILDQAASDVTTFGILLVALSLVSFGAQFVQRRMTGHIGHSILRDMRSLMFSHLNKLSLSFYDREEIGRVMSRVTSDVVTLQELMTTGFLNVLADIIGLAIIVVAIFLLDPMLAAVTMVVVPVLVGFMVVWQKFAAKAFIRVRQAIALVNSNINENVSGVRVVQSLGREEENLRQFDELNRQNRDMNMNAARLQAAVMPLVEILSTVATVLVIFVIGVRAFNGSISAGEVSAFTIGFLLYIQRFFNPVRDIVLQYTMLQRAMAGAHRIFEVLDTVPEIQDAEDAVVLDDVEGRVDFNHVQFSYVEGVPVLRDFDLHVKPGETIAFVGHTGAGKTSVTALVNRSYDIQGGEILIDGVDLKQIQRASLTRRMSVVLQEPYLFSGTIRSNILYGRLDATDEEVEEAARAVGAHDFISRLPDRYDSELHERGQNLSVGQRQLIAFARAVIANPRILILDEATANVDTQSERIIQETLKTLLKGRTSFVIAHRLSTIRDADRIVVMAEGEIVEIGSHDELMLVDGVYADLYRMTFAESAGETAEARTPLG